MAKNTNMKTLALQPSYYKCYFAFLSFLKHRLAAEKMILLNKVKN